VAREPIAIVGRGCVLPGALHPDAFWQNIAAGRSSLSPVPEGRWRLPGAQPGQQDPDGAGWAEVGGYVHGLDEVFDPDGFSVGAAEIMRLDPLYRWVLHAGRQALRETGLPAGMEAGLAGRAGLVLGNLCYPSAGLTRLAEQVWRDGRPVAGTDLRDRFCSGLPAHFAARALGLGAGSFALDAACASSLYAVKLGCDRLHDGTADLMLAGAVTAPDDLLIHSGFRALGALSRTGRSRPFHRGADGLVPGEGAVLMALMRLGDAIRAGAPIFGVIRAVGLSNDGQDGGLLAPAEAGQARAMRLAYEAAGVPPETASLLECHATGTPVGDGVEARSAGRVFAACPDLPIGSVKSNVGHLLAVAGGAGLLKVLGAMQAGVRPATLSADDPIGELDGSPLRLLAEPEDWPGPRRAAVSAFGFGGANAHLIVDAWEGPAGASPSRPAAAPARPAPPPAPAPEGTSEPVAIVAIGARVADGADAEDFRQAVLLGELRPGRRTSIDVALAGLRFPPVDLQSAHAQHVLVLEAAREAVRGVQLPRERTMVVIGMGTDPEVARYAALRRTAGGPVPAPEILPLTAAGVLGTMPNLVANRINMQLDLTGPGCTVSAEEGSGLVALAIAARALRTGEADAALAGAVDLSCEPIHETATRALGREQSPGDAAVVLVLRRLADARRLGDRVIAVLDDGSAGPAQPELVVGDGDPGDGPDRLDPARLFGVAHAAHGLVAVAAAATAVRHQVRPHVNGPGPTVARGLTALATVRPLGGPPLSVALRPAGPAEPWAAGPAPSWHVYSGTDRDAVLRALAAGQESATGPARLVLVANDAQPLPARGETARQWLTSGGPRPAGIAYRDAPVGGEVAFVFTNGSAAYPGMGTELNLAFPAVADTFGTSAALLRSHAGDEVHQGPLGTVDVLGQILGAALLAGQHAEISRGILGLRPTAAIGYSSGESAALAALGAWPDTRALYADLRASELFRTGLTGDFRAVLRVWQRLGVPGDRWASYLVSATPDRVRAMLAGEAAVHLMAVTAPDACVVGGEAAACQAALRRLGADSYSIDYAIAAHAPELADVRDEYRRLHLRPTRDVPGVRFYSGATGEPYAVSADRAADAIVAQALGTVDFVRVIERAWADGVRVFVEHGPQGQCTGWIRRILGSRPHVAVALDAAGGRALRQMYQAVAELAAAGVPVDSAALAAQLDPAAGRRVTVDPGPVIRLPAHPPRLQLAQPAAAAAQAEAAADAVTSPQPAATAMPRAPMLPPVLDGYAPADAHGPADAHVPPDRDIPAAGPVPAGAGPVSGPPAVPAIPATPATARLVAAQFQQASALHQDFLARQAQAHAQFLYTRQQMNAALTRVASRADSREQAAPAPGLRPGPKFGRDELEHLAGGKISDLFGPRFAAQDGRHRQTRLPEPPMLLVDRVTGIDGTAASMGTGTIWTETDVTLDGWYLDGSGRIPAGLMVEAGQADLLLISWLGVDLHTRSDRVYRLLGCELTYHGSPAQAGETLRYEIRIDRHAKQGGVGLFFFSYDCYVGDDLRMSVRNGQAGFFTDDELSQTKGVQWDPAQEHPGDAQIAPPRQLPAARRFGPDAVRAYASGRPADCFGDGWRAAWAHVRTPRISDGRLLLLSEVTAVDPAGGPWQRGYLRAETAVNAGDWFFSGHFKNDPCMPGTLMFEGGLQAMAFYLAALGFTLDHDGWRFEPVTGQECLLRCRGQVSPSSHRVVYEVFVSELSAAPYPTLYADVLGTVDGVKAFHARRAGLRLVPDWPLEYWRQLGPPMVQPSGQPVPLPALGGLRGPDRPAGLEAGRGPDHAALAGGIRQDYAALLSYAWGRFSAAIGPLFADFDQGRRAPRLPGPPYHFMTRVIAVDGPLGGMQEGSTVTAEYDVPDQAWYFEQNASGAMPFAVLMEIALQPCGWLAMYAGSVLGSPADLVFRNLDGTGTVQGEVRPGSGALRTRAELRHISRSGGMIIETFAVECSVAGGPADGVRVFAMDTVFGFFPAAMMAQQAGLPASATERERLAEPSERAADLRAGPEQREGAAQPADASQPADAGRKAGTGQKVGTGQAGPGLARLAGPMLLMLDRITGYWPGGGAAGLGRLRAEKDVDPGEWFFRAHFFQDPVQPGSLGVEAMCQLLQWYLIEREMTVGLRNPRFEPVLPGQPVTWRYRGQVVPANERISIEMEITAQGADDRGRYAIGTAWLWVDGLRIYQVHGLGMRVVPG
jgi:acyl transferase domain-containing protein/3-hydroxymyristoyl/3-hydroxydecanoyl-(acyl carrier protein) dehydratase